jgi:dihydroneopterin aldolase
MDYNTGNEGLNDLYKEVQGKLRRLSQQQLAETSLFIDNIQNSIHRKLPEEIEYNKEKQAFLDQIKTKCTKRSYHNALLRWEKFFQEEETQRIEKEFYEIGDRTMNDFIDQHLMYVKSSNSQPPIAINTIIRDISVFFSFYDYLRTKYTLKEYPVLLKKYYYRRLKIIRKEIRLPKNRKERIPKIDEINKIYKNLLNKEIALFAVKMAYLYGLLPKDFERIQIKHNFLIFQDGQKKELVPELRKLAKIWQEQIEYLGSDEYGNKKPIIDKWNTQIADRIRKLTKNMKKNGLLKYAYTLTDIKNYFDYDIAKIEKSHR